MLHACLCLQHGTLLPVSPASPTFLFLLTTKCLPYLPCHAFTTGCHYTATLLHGKEDGGTLDLHVDSGPLPGDRLLPQLLPSPRLCILLLGAALPSLPYTASPSSPLHGCCLPLMDTPTSWLCGPAPRAHTSCHSAA